MNIYKYNKSRYVLLQGGNYKCNPNATDLLNFCKKNKNGIYKTLDSCIVSCMDIKRDTKIFGEVILEPTNYIKFFHNSPAKFLYPNKIVNWLSMLKSKEVSTLDGITHTQCNIINKYGLDTPFWSNNGQHNDTTYNYIYRLRKPINMLIFDSLDSSDLSFDKIIDIFINNNSFSNKPIYKNFSETSEYKKFIDTHNVSFDDYEYKFAYYICTMTKYNGWLSNSGQFGYIM